MPRCFDKHTEIDFTNNIDIFILEKVTLLNPKAMRPRRRNGCKWDVTI